MAPTSPDPGPDGDVAGDNDGHPIQVAGATRDFTESLAAVAAQRLAAIVESSDDAIIGKNLDGIIESWNRGAEAIFGYTADEMIGTSITRLIPAQRQHEEAEILALIRSGQRIDHFETVRQRKDGRLIDVSVTASPIKDARGHIVGVSKIARETTQRKRAEEQIAEQAAFLDKARDAIIAVTIEGEVRFWNQGAEQMYGWTRQEVTGRPFAELIGADPGRFAAATEETIRLGEWQGELQYFTRQRRELTVEARWTLILDGERRPNSILAINTDVTKRKQLEVQFMRAQRMESIGVLASGIAHDLNNILAPIMMSIEVLKGVVVEAPAAEMLEAIEVSAKRGADIVRQVLSFARGMAGERIEVQLKHLLRDLESMIRNTFPKNVRLQFWIPDDVWVIWGDPTQVQQILMNLCVNARDAMSAGGRLSLTVENCTFDEHYAAMNAEARPGRYVAINVSDSGAGIPPAIVARIFEPFFTTKAVGKGTGLGLSTVMAIVKSHDGFVTVASEVGRGTTFKVYLPAMVASPGAFREGSKRAPLSRGRGETILVIDDEASILTITSQTLQAFGYRILTAKDGAAGLAVYLQHVSEVALVVTDIMMPVMDGAALIHALLRTNGAIKIIATSGQDTGVERARAAGPGVHGILTKPYTARTLLETVRAVLDGG